MSSVRKRIGAVVSAIGGVLGFRRKRDYAERRATKSGRSQSRRDVRRRALEAETARLETELDQIYAQLARRTNIVGNGLTEMIKLAGGLKEKLRENRDELSKIKQRDAARKLHLRRNILLGTGLRSKKRPQKQ